MKSDNPSSESVIGAPKSHDPSRDKLPDTVVERLLLDIKTLPGRFNTYKTNVQSQLKGADKILALTESANTVIETLGSKLLHEFLPEDKLNSLVGKIHENTRQSLDLIPTDKEKSKFLLKAARVEATIKGFDVGDLEKQDVKNFGLNENESKKAVEATKQAVLELANTEVPRAEYVSRVLEKSIEILNKDNTLTPQQNESYRHFIGQGEYSVKIDEHGVKTPRPSKVNDEERKIISDAAVQSTATLEKELDAIMKESADLKKGGLSVQNVIKSISEFVQSVPEAVSNFVQTIPEVVSNFVQNSWSNIKSWLKPKQTKLENPQNKPQDIPSNQQNKRQSTVEVSQAESVQTSLDQTQKKADKTQNRLSSRQSEVSSSSIQVPATPRVQTPRNSKDMKGGGIAG
jgi:hypothetical protein